MSADSSADSPLVKQVKKMIGHLLATGKAGEFIVADLPDYEPEYLADLERRIDWTQTPHSDAAHKTRILYATALEEVLTALRRGLCRKLGDRGLYALFSLEPEARRPPWFSKPKSDSANQDPLAEDLKDLKDRNWRVRMKAAERIGLLGPKAKAAVPALIEVLKDETITPSEAAQALGRIGSEADAAVPALLEFWRRNPHSWEPGHALESIGTPRAMAALQEARKDPIQMLRKVAGEIFADIRSKTKKWWQFWK